MGIKDLWSVLTPFCERKPLYELQGKTVAVDLSCWICEAQNISEYQVQPRMYLRNLYFRTCYLLLMEVTPVFVLEGKAPELKYQTIADRNAIQFKGAKPKSDKVKTGKDRSRFHFVLKQCEDMLRHMGLACITGVGEAECLCAHLNEEGLVAGCISQDSDCFAYGAKVVYRNFSISTQGSYAASGGAVDVYDIQKANDFLKFGRNKIIALALLCGSDYNDGVFGVGRESAMKFINRYDDDTILEKIRSWRSDDYVYERLENKINNKNICTSCGHDGKIQSHTKNGCGPCGTTKGCDFSKYRDERLEIKNELMIRTKSLVDPDFPNEELINEFLVKKDKVKNLDLRWKQPDLINFVKFTNKFLGWEEIYAFEKFLPILTRWQLLNYKYINECLEQGRSSEVKGIIYPEEIKKIRNPKGIPSYEIIWIDKHEFFKHLIPDEQLEKYKEDHKGSLDGFWNTIEPKNLVETAYPKLVEEFFDKKNAKKAKKPSKRKPKNSVDEINEMLQNTSITEPKPKKTRAKTTKTQKNTLDKFLENNKDDDNGNYKENNGNNKENDNGNIVNVIKSLNNIKTISESNDSLISTVPIYKTKVNLLKQEARKEAFSNSFDLDASKFGDEDDMDISDIIDEIVNRSVKLPKSLTDMGYKIQTPQKYTTGRFNDSFENYEDNRELCDYDDDKNFNDSFENTDSKLSPIKETSRFSSTLSSTPLRNRLPSITKSNVNQSSFFDNFNDKDDLFEKSLRKNCSDSDSDTIEYDIDNVEPSNDESSEEEYVPLIQRLKGIKNTEM